MSIIADIRDAVNDHVTRVSSLHRLRFAAVIADEKITTFQCVCDFQGDRSSWNDHIDEMYRVAAIEPLDLTSSVRMSEQAKVEVHRGRVTRAAR